MAKRIDELQAILDRATRLYYESGTSDISDSEYDALSRELEALKYEHLELGETNAEE